MRKVFHLAIALILVAVLPLHALAASTSDSASGEQTITPYYSYTGTVTASLSITGSTAQCSGSAQPDSGYTASVRVVLYRSSDGKNWTELTSWSGNGTTGNAASASGSKSVSSGYKYKVTTFGTVKNGSSVVESPSKSTAIKSY